MRRLFRWLVITSAVLAIVALAVRAFVVQGLLFPVRINGDSMAYVLQGAHWKVVCEDCGFEFRCGLEHPPGDQVTCPNCGFQDNDRPGQAELQPGQRVLIDKFTPLVRPLRRWEVVVTDDPSQRGRLAVKRVVGFPGEKLAIRNGEIYANGIIRRKSFQRQKGLGILVYDDRFRSQLAENTARRWQADAAESRWRDVGGTYQFHADGAASGVAADGKHPAGVGQTDLVFDWLTYRNYACLPRPALRDAESPVRDDYGYNQGLSRELNEVSDLRLACRIKLTGAGWLGLLVHDGRDNWEVRLTPANGDVRLRRSNEELLEARVGVSNFDSWIDLELAVFDRQLVVAIDGQTLVEHTYGVSSLPWQPTSRPLALGALGLEVEVKDIRVYRDIYYMHPAGLQDGWEMATPLGTDEYFLVGDNNPVSLDSRHWPSGSVTRKKILGLLWPRPKKPC